jgi:hypothetical protein
VLQYFLRNFKGAFVRTVLLVLGIWVLINVLFVVIMMPRRKQKNQGAPQASGSNKEAYPFHAEEKTSLGFMIISAAMVAVFALSPPIADAATAIKRAFRKNRPLIGTDPPTE